MQCSHNSGIIIIDTDIVVAEAEICQLADIQDSIQRMREGDLSAHPGADKQSVEARLVLEILKTSIDQLLEIGTK